MDVTWLTSALVLNLLSTAHGNPNAHAEKNTPCFKHIGPTGELGAAAVNRILLQLFFPVTLVGVTLAEVFINHFL